MTEFLGYLLAAAILIGVGVVAAVSGHRSKVRVEALRLEIRRRAKEADIINQTAKQLLDRFNDETDRSNLN